MPDQTEPVKTIQHEEPPAPKTWKEFFIGILWRDIDAELGGGRALRMNVVIWLIVLASLVGGLVVLEWCGIIDDVKDMVTKRHAQK